MLFLTELRAPVVAPTQPTPAAHTETPQQVQPSAPIEHKPALSFVEAPDAWWLTIEVPGMTAEALEITLANGHLTVRGEKRLPQAEGLVFTDRGIYRPGETVHLTALVRDARAVARSLAAG